jgi:predicted hydrocarbon binding protein
MNALSYPQSMGQILRRAMEDVLGEERADSALEMAGPLMDNGNRTDGHETFSSPSLSRLSESLEQIYGPQGGRGMSLRIGRACVQYGLREFGSTLGLTTTAFRLLPLPVKLRTASGVLADMFNKRGDQKIRVEQQDGKLLWHIEHCLVCRERHTDKPACHLAVGLAQEALHWLSGGKIFVVEEIACVAQGDPTCTLQIDETPLS